MSFKHGAIVNNHVDTKIWYPSMRLNYVCLVHLDDAKSTDDVILKQLYIQYGRRPLRFPVITHNGSNLIGRIGGKILQIYITREGSFLDFWNSYHCGGDIDKPHRGGCPTLFTRGHREDRDLCKIRKHSNQELQKIILCWYISLRTSSLCLRPCHEWRYGYWVWSNASVNFHDVWYVWWRMSPVRS